MNNTHTHEIHEEAKNFLDDVGLFLTWHFRHRLPQPVEGDGDEKVVAVFEITDIRCPACNTSMVEKDGFVRCCVGQCDLFKVRFKKPTLEAVQ